MNTDLVTKKSAAIETIVADATITNLSNPTYVISWGAEEQGMVRQINNKMLEGVKAKDAGQIGDALTDMVMEMRGLDFGSLSTKQNFLSKLLSRVTPVARFVMTFEEVSSQVVAISNKLELHKVELLQSIHKLESLYEATTNYYHSLSDYVDSGDQILALIDKHIEEAREKASETGDPIDAQSVMDLTDIRSTFERRVHDINLSRSVVMQTLAQVRMIQTNDKALVHKIDTQITNTIPLWESQLVIAIEQWKLAEATKTTKKVSDLQNEILVKNAEMLKQGNADTRREIERGVYDIESVKKANDLLIATIEETISITAEAKTQRASALEVLNESEQQLIDVMRRA